MYGGRNFNVSKVNLATGDGGSGRQAGSAFKPFTLATAIEQGYSLNSRWYGPSSITIPDPACYTDGAALGALEREPTRRAATSRCCSATTYSVNTVFAQVASAVTPEAIVETAPRAWGSASPLEPVCSITLGTQAVTPLEMTDAYATLAARGWRHRASPLERVDTADGGPTCRSAGAASRSCARTTPTSPPTRSRA